MSLSTEYETDAFEIIQPVLTDLSLAELRRPADNEILRVRGTTLGDLQDLPHEKVPFLATHKVFRSDFTDWHPDAMATTANITVFGACLVGFAGVTKDHLGYLSLSQLRNVLTASDKTNILEVEALPGDALFFNGTYSAVAMCHRFITTVKPRLSYGIPIVRWGSAEIPNVEANRL